MKYLVIEEKWSEIKYAKAIVRKFYPDVKCPHFKKGKPQFYFEKGELTKRSVAEIASELGMEVISISNARAVIGY